MSVEHPDQSGSMQAEPKPEIPPDYSGQLSNAVALASTTNQIVWTVFGIFWAANAVLLVALFTTGDLPRRTPGLVVAAVGLALSAVWFLIQLRAILYLGFYEGVIRELESKYLKIPAAVALSRELSDQFLKSVGSRFWSMRAIMLLCAVASCLAWLWAFAWFLRSNAV